MRCGDAHRCLEMLRCSVFCMDSCTYQYECKGVCVSMMNTPRSQEMEVFSRDILISWDLVQGICYCRHCGHEA